MFVYNEDFPFAGRINGSYRIEKFYEARDCQTISVVTEGETSSVLLRTAVRREDMVRKYGDKLLSEMKSTSSNHAPFTRINIPIRILDNCMLIVPVIYTSRGCHIIANRAGHRGLQGTEQWM